jgi:hypothetical protein
MIIMVSYMVYYGIIPFSRSLQKTTALVYRFNQQAKFKLIELAGEKNLR